MKRMVLFLVCVSAGFAGYSDGFITAGEYEFGVTWKSYDPPLIVDGGGADNISVRDHGRLIVKSTSKPLSAYQPVGGVYDILLFDTSHLLYLDGVTELIMLTANGMVANTAELKGGSINYLKSGQYTTMIGADPHIDLYCLPGHSWISDNPLLGVEGQWWDGSPFRIKFINVAGFDPAWTNINFITPEPATLLMLLHIWA